MHIFLTGGSGFVGGAVGQHLAERHQVRAMARSEASAVKVRARGMEPVDCSLDDLDAADLRGAEVVIHSAAKVEAFGKRADFFRHNVEATERLLREAQAAGVGRFIFISTEQAVFADAPIVNGDESLPYPARQTGWYAVTKSLAEQRVLAADAPGFTTLALRPRLVWGPGDQTILPALLTMVRSGRFRWIDGGAIRTSTAHIDNVVHAVERALTAGRGGQAYFITDGEVWTFRDFATRLLETQGVRAPDGSLPGWAARVLARVLETTWNVFSLSGEPPLSRTAVALMTNECTLQIDKAKRELGYTPHTSVVAGLATMPKL